MIILTIKTDNPTAELGLYKNQEKISYEKWQAHLQLAETIHKKIKEIVNKSSISMKEVEGIVAFSGPGSFTGLRIGLSVANTLAYADGISVVGSNTENWIKMGIEKLLAGENEKVVMPEYGQPPKTTTPR